MFDRYADKLSQMRRQEAGKVAQAEADGQAIAHCSNVSGDGPSLRAPSQRAKIIVLIDH